MLRRQSEKRWIVKLLTRWGWLDLGSEQVDQKGQNKWARWWKNELEMKMGASYNWEQMPAEFNAWLMFRQFVDIVLLKWVIQYVLVVGWWNR